MRSRTYELLFVALFLLPLLFVPAARASRKQQTILIALDQSGSMVQSDPGRLRVEAAGLLAATENPKDQVGVIAFGDSARWVQQPIERDRFQFSLLDKIGASDAHTSFSSALQIVEGYLVRQPPSFFQDHDVSLVLLTDGRSDPADKLADADRSEALSIASQNAWRLKIYTIGLGNTLDLDFLDRLARATHGFSIQATSATDLPDAFLRVAARAATLPVYVRSSSPQSLTWAGTPQRVVVVFTGEHAASLQLPGNILYRSEHVAVAEEDPTAHAAKPDWTGNGLAFLCVQEPLSLSAGSDFPVALLTNAPHPISLTLESQHGPIQNAYFLESASAHLELTGQGDQTVPLSVHADTGSFTGELQAQTAGSFQAHAYLDSPYGDVETYLGQLTAYVTPVALPEQLSAGVFDPLPRSWFPETLPIRQLLPVGTVNLQFSAPASPVHGAARNEVSEQMPASLGIVPGQSSELRMVLGGAPGLTHVIDYSATWSDGESEVTRHGALRVLAYQMTAAELIEMKWPWALGVLLLLCVAIVAGWNFWPRPLQADLIVRRNGAQVLRLRLPSQQRTRTLLLSEGRAENPSAPGRAVIAGSQSRDLLSLQSARRGGRWTIVAQPRAALAPTQQGRSRSEIDLRANHVPVFATEDGTIQINVLYS